MKKIKLITILLFITSLSTINAQENYNKVGKINGKREFLTSAIMSCVKEKITDTNQSSSTASQNITEKESQITNVNSAIMKCISTIDESILKMQQIEGEEGTYKYDVRIEENNCPSVTFEDSETNCIYKLPLGRHNLTISTNNINTEQVRCRADFTCKSNNVNNTTGGWNKVNSTEYIRYKNPVTGKFDSTNHNDFLNSQYCSSQSVNLTIDGINLTTNIARTIYNGTYQQDIIVNGFIYTITTRCINPQANIIRNQWSDIKIGDGVPACYTTPSNEEGVSNKSKIPINKDGMIVWSGEIWDEQYNIKKSIICEAPFHDGNFINDAHYRLELDNFSRGHSTLYKETHSDWLSATFNNNFKYGHIEFKCINGVWKKTSSKCQNAPKSCITIKNFETLEEKRNYIKINPINGEEYQIAYYFITTPSATGCTNLDTLNNQIGIKPVTDIQEVHPTTSDGITDQSTGSNGNNNEN